MGPKPVVASFLGQDGVPPELRGDDERRTVPSFAFPEAAARALGRLADLSDWRGQAVGTEPDFDDMDVEKARRLIADQLGGAPEEGVWLDARAANRLLGCFGISTADTSVVHDAEGAARAAAELGYPVVLKAGSPEIVHKTDVGGVALGLQDAAAVREAFEQMVARLGDAMGGGILQATAPPGIETIVGVTQDPAFGPLVLFGLGGIAAELLADRAPALVPITDEDAHRLVRSLRSAPLLFGYRGAPRVDVDALEELLMRIGKLADVLPEVAELDLNPVVVGSHGALPVDVKVRCAARVAADAARLSSHARLIETAIRRRDRF